MSDAGITARCYCGHISLSSPRSPITVAFCHCADCKRWAGKPVPAFAAIASGILLSSPKLGDPVVTNPGVAGWNCPKCSSPLAATLDYLPDQIYIPLGLIDQADDLPAKIHCHADQHLNWLRIEDTLERTRGSGRATLANIST